MRTVLPQHYDVTHVPRIACTHSSKGWDRVWLAVTVDKSSVSFRIARSIEAWIREKVARSPRSSLLRLTFTIYALPSIPRNLRRALPHYRIILAGQKHVARPTIPGSTQIQRGSSCLKPNSQCDFRRDWRWTYIRVSRNLFLWQVLDKFGILTFP